MNKFSMGLILSLLFVSALSFAQSAAPARDCCEVRETIVKQGNALTSTNQKAMEANRKNILARLPPFAVTKEDISKALCGDEITPRSTQIQSQINETRGELQPVRAPDWLKLTGWQVKTKVKFGHIVDESTPTNLQCVFSKYGAESPNKDFAEAVKVYRFKPSVLQTQCPDKYNYLREHVFNGKEFTSRAHCGA